MGSNGRNEKLLNLTLEIICVLTGEEYTVVKKSEEHVKRSNPTRVSKKLTRTQTPITVPGTRSLLHDRENEQKILELVNKIIQLMTGEEREYIEEQEEMFEETALENCQPLTFLDGTSNRGTPENCPSHPLLSQDTTEENHSDPQEEQDEHLPLVKVHDTEEDEEEHLPVVEDTGGEEEANERDDEQCEEKGEETTTYICADGYNTRNTSEEHPFVSPDCEMEGDDIAQESAGEIPITPVIHSELDGADVSSDPAYLVDFSPDDADIEHYIRALGVEYLFPSSIDGNCFSQNTSRATYQPAEMSELPFPQSGCRKYVRDKSNVVRRKSCRRAERSMPCPECGKSIKNKWYFAQHLRLHTGDLPFPCPLCPKRFLNKSSLASHNKSHTGERPHSCPECGKSFRDKSYLIQHQTLHTGDMPFPCPACPKRYMNKAALAVHERSHTGEKPYSCPECGKCFKSTSHRAVHLRVHKGEKPFVCTECGKGFVLKSGLTVHQKTHNGEKPFSCAQCGKCFSTKFTLVIHGRSHTGEKPFPCLECGKSYTQRKRLMEHQRIHTGEKPYPCMECGKHFRVKAHLVVHQTIHTRNK